MTERYVELHARSAFSFLEGASLPEAMTQQAANLELPGLAILDRDGLYGSPRLYTTAKKLGLRSHIGAEVSVDAFGQQAQPPRWQPHTIPSRPVRLSLLCESQTGYRNLSMLISGYKLAQRSKGDGMAPFRKVEQYAEGLVCMTGGDEGPLAASLERGGMDEGRKVLMRLIQTFGQKNVYVELQRHGLCEQEARNQAAIALAREFHLPLLATNGVSMATEFEREILDVLTSIRHGCSLDEAGLLLQRNGKRHLRSASEMCRLFQDVPEAIAATSELSDRLSFQMKEMGYEFPRYPIPDGETMDSFLRKHTFEGVARRYGAKASMKLRARADKQVDTELALISKLGLAGYFLIVWDIVEFCREHDILVQGRGSAANSAVCYSLGITAVDPVGMELLFERFLSEVRGEWPDIDLDLPSGRTASVRSSTSMSATASLARPCAPTSSPTVVVPPPARLASHSASTPTCRRALPGWSGPLSGRVRPTRWSITSGRQASIFTIPALPSTLSFRSVCSICPGTLASTQAA